MTHKDFVLIAGALAAARRIANDPAAPEFAMVCDIVTTELAKALAGTNPRFDRSRFIAAAAGTPTTKRDVVRS